MAARTLMVQGTGSYVGKSVVTAALCAFFREQGFRVAPFKSQNMSNNSCVTATGGEIGRAQAFQAMACGVEPTVEMNPILLKPSSDNGSQVVVLGKPVRTMNAREYHAYQPELLPIIRRSLERLCESHDIVVIEGAGSPAEINLRQFDIVNMAVAKMAHAPVLLVGDINLGGVFASLVGTLELLEEDERSLVHGFIINKFRGDASLLEAGFRFLEAKTGKRVLGVLPYLNDLRVAEEDSIPEWKWNQPRLDDPHTLRIEVVLFPHISNSTDFEPLETELDVSLRYLAKAPESSAPPVPDAIILPGSKSTIADLSYLKSSGLADYVSRCRRSGATVVGICGGYQMLGRKVLDPERVESSAPEAEGLGFLDNETVFQPTKTTVQVRGTAVGTATGIAGYEIHMGETSGTSNPMFRITAAGEQAVNRFDGAKTDDGLVWGTYIHGIFDSPSFRNEFLNELRRRRGWAQCERNQLTRGDEIFSRLAALVRHHVDVSTVTAVMNKTVLVE